MGQHTKYGVIENTDEFITLYLKDVKPFLPAKNAQRVVLRYLHDQGVEGEIGSDEKGNFIRYYRPADDIFHTFSAKLYEFITNYCK